MAKNRVIYCIAVVACVIFSMCYTSTLSAILLAVVLIYPILAAVFTLVQLLSVKVGFIEKRVIVEKDTPFELSIGVKNQSILPCVPLELVCNLPDNEQEVMAEKRIFASLSPLCKARLQFPCRHLYRGCYYAEIKKMSVVDPLRIIRLSKKTDIGITMVFLPRKLKLQALGDNIIGSGGSVPDKNPAAEKEDLSHVRDDRDGDNIQLVHWKLTAKRDEFMIKQYDSLNERHAVVLPDFGGNNQSEPMLYADTVVETALAFVRIFVENKINVSFDLGQLSERKIMNVANEAEFEELYEFLSIIPADTKVCDYADLIDSVNPEEELFTVLITDRLSEEFMLRARAAAEHSAVFVAYINLRGGKVDDSIYGERFCFLDIRGTGETALNAAVEKALNTNG